jgi:LAO/AO transport system kinase
VTALAERLLGGDRRALARAITLVESTRPDHREQAAELLEAVRPHTGRAVRLGVSGPPGAGKSTFLQAYGLHLVDDRGQRIAVLAVDPSSTRSGGSILGDKTRMPELAARPAAFIRPSPAGAGAGPGGAHLGGPHLGGPHLGGIARRTREALLLCEASGVDQVVVETVGVGQSETAVAGIVDTMALLLPPAAGDDLQGIKRGVMELADVVVVTKADGDLRPAARGAAADARQGLALLRRRHPGWDPPVLLTSALQAEGVREVADAVAAHRGHLDAHGLLEVLRREQDLAWLVAEVTDGLLARFRADPAAGAALDDAIAAVRSGRTSPTAAARTVLAGHPAGAHGR